MILYQVNLRNKPLLENEVIVIEAIEEGNSQGNQEPLAGNIQEDEEINAIKETPISAFPQLSRGSNNATWTRKSGESDP